MRLLTGQNTFAVRPSYGVRARYSLALVAGFTAVGAAFGGFGLASGTLDLPPDVPSRLPAHSPVLAGIALAVVVALPMAVAAWTVWRRRPGADVTATIAGLLLVGWIVLEVLVIRSFGLLQPVFAVVGLAVALAGYRSWHLRWGASQAEVDASMPGDEEVPGAQFCATRAIMIAAVPEEVWPWLVQVGRNRAGFYSYDQLDNGGLPSVRQILPQYQEIHIADLAAPMTTVGDEFDDAHRTCRLPDDAQDAARHPSQSGTPRLASR